MISFRLWVSLAGAGVILVLVSASHIYAYRAGSEAGRRDALSKSVELLRERNSINEKVRGMSPADLCAALGGLPDECASDGL